jgi:hypothetical protein
MRRSGARKVCRACRQQVACRRQDTHGLASLGFIMRLTSANLRVFLALPMLPTAAAGFWGGRNTGLEGAGELPEAVDVRCRGMREAHRAPARPTEQACGSQRSTRRMAAAEDMHAPCLPLQPLYQYLLN